MKKMTLAALALLLIAALAGCSSSSTGPSSNFKTPFNFAGNWTFKMTVAEDPVGWSADDRSAPLGSSYDSQYVIEQAGTNVALHDNTSRFSEDFAGTCDTTAGTIRAEYHFNGNYIVTVITLTADGDNSMTGTWVSDEQPSPGFASGKHIKNTIKATRN
jgi:hypothetical protein